MRRITEPKLSAGDSRRLFKRIQERLADAEWRDATVRIVNALADMMPQLANVVGSVHIQEFYAGVKDLDAADSKRTTKPRRKRG